MRKWDEAKRELGLYWEGVKYYEENPDGDMNALVLLTAFDMITKKRMHSVEAGCALMRGDVSVLEKVYDEIGLAEPTIYVAEGFAEVLAEAEATLPEHPVLERAMRDVINNDAWGVLFLTAIQKYCERNRQAFPRMFELAARAGCDMGICDVGLGQDWQYEMASLQIGRARVIAASTYAPLQVALKDYRLRAHDLAEKYFTDEAIENYPELLPDLIYCGLCIWRASEQDEGSKEEREYLDLAAKCDAGLLAPLTAFLLMRRASKS